MTDLSIIIVSYNTKDYILKCLESIYKSGKNLSFEIIVVDNSSKDSSVESLLKLKDNNLRVIVNKENLGFSKANNIGVKASKGEYILFLNPDTIVNSGVLQGMVDFMNKNPEAGAASCEVLLPNGKIDDASHRGFPTPWNSFAHFSGLSRIFGNSKFSGGYNLKHLNLKAVHEIDVLAGSFMIVRRKAGEEVGWWDEDYFFYGEDIEFCYMLKQKGWKIYYVPEFSILHYKGISGGIKKHSKHLSTADHLTRKKATEERFNAMKIFYKKHYEQKYPWIVTRLVYTGIWLKEFFA